MMWFPSVILSLWMVLNRNLSPTLRHLAEAIGYRTLDRGDWAERGF